LVAVRKQQNPANTTLKIRLAQVKNWFGRKILSSITINTDPYVAIISDLSSRPSEGSAEKNLPAHCVKRRPDDGRDKKIR
jgi:hypothetical protein